VPNLQSVGIDGRQFDGPAVDALKRAPLLVEMYLYTPFDAEAIGRLPALPQVREIRLMGAPLDRVGAEALTKVPSLRTVSGEGANEAALALLRVRPPDIWLDVVPATRAPAGRAAKASVPSIVGVPLREPD
jgi:hypothetical protein